VKETKTTKTSPTRKHINTRGYQFPHIATGAWTLLRIFLTLSSPQKLTRMPYKVVVNNDGPSTLKQIADAHDIEYQKGQGFYELAKKESVASKKSIILFENGNFVTDSDANIRARCGFPASGDLNISESDLPPNTQLFIQSTAPNRKIPTGSAVLFYVEGGTVSSSSASAAPQIQYAIKYEDLLSDRVQEIVESDELHSLFNVPVGTDFNDCDTPVPMAIQLPSLWYISKLSNADWTSVDIKIEDVPCLPNERVTRVSATGSVTLPDVATGTPTLYPVCLEYKWDDEWSFYAVSVGMVWGALLGSCGAHPYVLTPQINYGNSDGSSSEMPPIAICECSERRKATNPQFDCLDIRVTNKDRMDPICGHLMRTFSAHCSDSDH
jgi:hypothetical protein